MSRGPTVRCRLRRERIQGLVWVLGTLVLGRLGFAYGFSLKGAEPANEDLGMVLTMARSGSEAEPRRESARRPGAEQQGRHLSCSAWCSWPSS